MPIDLPPPSENLALHARATASEEYQAFAPQLAIDGDPATRWSGIPGHNEGVWFELDWPHPVDVGCVVIHQFDRFTMEMDVEAWDDKAATWKALGHFGRAGPRLPLVVVWRGALVKTTKLRLDHITNGPSFNEVEVFPDPWAVPPIAYFAGDANGHVVGVVTDEYGSAPVAGASVFLDAVGRTGPWRADAVSDEFGRFTVVAPPGLHGEGSVTVLGKDFRTRDDERNVAVSVTSDLPVESFRPSDLALALTPNDPGTPNLDLNGTWRFATDLAPGNAAPTWSTAEFDESSWLAAPVPSHLVMHGLEPANGVAAARRRFARPRFPADARVKLRFDGVYSGAEVFLNGKRCAGHVGGATPFEVDVTELLRDGDNLLAVRMREHTDVSDKLDRMSQYADFPLLGIWRDVKLFAVPDLHVASFAVTTSRAGGRDATLDLRVSIANESGQPFDGELSIALAGPDGRAESLSESRLAVQSAPWSRADVKLAPRVTAPAWWDAEHPNLHALTFELRSGTSSGGGAPQKLVQHLTQRIGFRETSVRGTELLINGAPVKFRGTCHHDGRPLAGRAVTAADEREDLELIRGANLNSLRTSHYPPNPALLDGADELGLYVEDEASFCWVGDSDDLRLAPQILQLTAELVARDRNHPSVFMWSLCNESSFGWGFERSHEWVRAADPSRPTGAAISQWLEIATLHNPITLDRIAENEGIDRPLLFDESLCIFQGIWNDVGEMWLDPGVRDAYVLPNRAIADKLFASRATQGSMIWCFADDLFCVPGRGLEYGRSATRVHFAEPALRIAGRGIVGDAPWGFVDGWRRLKPEYFHVKKLHAPVRVAARSVAAPAAGQPIRIDVENRYDQTDLSELRVEWTLGGERRTATLSAPPRSHGVLELAPTAPIAPDSRLELRFTDARGLVVEECELPIDGSTAPALPLLPPLPALRIEHEGTLSGESTRVIGGSFELAFDQRTGALRRATANGSPVLLAWLAPHRLESGAALAAPIDPLPSRLDALEITPRNDGGAEVRLRGAWQAFEGTIVAQVERDGRVAAHAELVHKGPDFSSRELGLTLGLLPDATHLAWERDAEWSAYPRDHIGRPVGEADAFPERVPAAGDALAGPPTWPVALDPSPMGCNDFRSTKRTFRRVALTDAAGGGIEVLSDGTQHARARVAGDRVLLHVNFVSEGTGSGLWEWEHNYGHGRLVKDGETIAGDVRFRLLAPRRPEVRR